MADMVWMRRRHRDVWHWIPACSNHPDPQRDDVVTATEEPTTYEKCDQCIAKERRANFEVEP